MKHATRLLFAAVLVVVFTTALVAQGGPGPGFAPGGPGRGFGGPGWGDPGHGMRFAIWGLKLSDEQRKKAQEIFQAAARQQRTLHEQLWEKQKAYADAKPGTDAEIDKRVAERAELMAKIEATHEKAFANFYNNVLTAEQRTQYDKLREARRAGGPGAGFCPGRGRGHGMMGGPGMGWGPRPGFGHGFGPGMGWEPGWGQGWRPGW